MYPSFEKITVRTSPGLAKLVRKWRGRAAEGFSPAEQRLMENPFIRARVKYFAFLDWVDSPGEDEMTFTEFKSAVSATYRAFAV